MQRPATATRSVQTLAGLCLASAFGLAVHATAGTWTMWHGPNYDGVAPTGEYPTSWSNGKNVAWSAELSGNGASTPCVWNDRIFLTDEVDGQNGLVCFDTNGNRLWTKTVGKLDPGKHKKASGANPSPTTDGKHVFAYFKSGDFAAFDFDGNEAWSVKVQDGNDPDMLWWDLGTSPVLTNDHVVVTVMQTGPSFLVAYDRATGDIAWKSDRMVPAPKEAAQSYTTPVVTTHNGIEQLIVCGADHVTSHRADNGQELWRVGGLNPGQDGFFRSISSPAIAGDIVVAPYARGTTVTAVRLGGKGDVTDTHVVWSKTGIGSDVPTPVIHDGKVYVLGDKGKTGGTIWVLDLQTGEEVDRGKLPKNRNAYSSSPILVPGSTDRLYITREDGTSYVVNADTLDVIGEGFVDDQTVATPVFIDNKILVRTDRNLWCFE